MDSKPVVIVRNKKAGGRERYVLDQKKATIGRDKSCYIVLPSKSISRVHAEITKEDGDFYVIDLKSSNGTFLNEQKLRPAEKNLLKGGDRIRIEHFEISFKPKGDEKEKDVYENTDTDLIEIKMLKKVLRAIDKDNAPSLEVTSGRLKGKRIVLDGKTQEATIGREASCEFAIDDDTISRKHARIVKRWDLVTLIDLRSKNGTYVGKERISEKNLKDGDRILLGNVSFHYRNPQDINFEAMAPKKEDPAQKREAGRRDNEEALPSPRPIPPPPSVAGPSSMARSASPLRRKSFSTSEILMILMGLAILVLAAVGITVLL